MTGQQRDPSGTPKGGQFSASVHDEPDSDLEEPWYVTDTPKTAELPLVARTDGKYVLRRNPGQEHGYSLWVDVPADSDDEFAGRSQLVSDDLPDTALEDFDTYVDNVEEEIRVMVSDAIEMFRD